MASFIIIMHIHRLEKTWYNVFFIFCGKPLGHLGSPFSFLFFLVLGGGGKRAKRPQR